MQIVLNTIEGKTLVGNNPTTNEHAEALRIVTGNKKKWAILVNGELSAIVQTWDAAVKSLRDDGFRVKIQ